MKVTLIVLLVTVAQVFATDLYSQNNRLSLKLEHAKIEDVLQAIESNSNYFFMYNASQVDVKKEVSISCKDKTLSEILTQLFEGTNVVYEINNRQVALKALNQPTQIKLTGKVTDSSGEPLPGVTVVVKGTTNGIITDVDGVYSLSNVPSDATMQFSFVGMKTQEIPISGKSTINIMLEEDAIGLEEVVAVGYGTMKKSDLTGSISSVHTDNLKITPLKSVSSILQGAVAGIEVIKGNHAPGGGSIVRIRGANSMNGSNDPLYVVDGMPGGFIGNPNDIESIQILKDASSTAIYGSRGANGVIIITTKRGKGQPSLNIDAYYGIQQIRKKLNLLNAREYAEFANEKANNIGRDPYFASDFSDLPGETDWQDEIFRIAPIQNYNISITGRNMDNSYAISGSLLQQDGIIRNSGSTEGSINLNLDNKINSWFSIETSIIASHGKTNSIPISVGQGSTVYRALMAPPVAPVFDDDGNYFELKSLPTSDPLWGNPVEMIEISSNTLMSNRFNGNTNLNFLIFDGLEYSFRLGLNYQNFRRDAYSRRTISNINRASIAESDDYSYLAENIVSYEKTFNKIHSLDVTAGFSWEESIGMRLSAGASDFVNDLLLTYNLASGSIIETSTSSKDKNSILSWIGRVNYTLANKYLFTATTRADGSSRLGANNKWGIFPSIAFGWRMSEESFMKNLQQISNLKFRVSYGVTGNQGIGNYLSLSRLSTAVALQGTDEERHIGFIPTVLQNPNLKWEVTKQVDIGFDLGLFEQKLDVSFDYYKKNTSDLLATVPLAISSGYSSITKNFGSMQNQGIELGLNSYLVNNSIWQVNLSANFSLNRNKVLEVATDNGQFFGPTIGSPIDSYVNIIKEGYPLSSFYGYLEDGLWDTDQTEGSIQPNAKAGDQKYVDVVPDGLINDEDKVILGDPNPDFIYAFNTAFNYKNFGLNILLQGVQGGKLFMAHKFSIADAFARNGNQFAEVKDHWTASNPDVNAKYPRLSNVSPLISDRYFEDASYLRFKTISLSYTIPSNTDFIRNLLVYVSGENLITFTKYSGYDPEVSSTSGSSLLKGVDAGAYPSAKTFTIGFKVEF